MTETITIGGENKNCTHMLVTMYTDCKKRQHHVQRIVLIRDTTYNLCTVNIQTVGQCLVNCTLSIAHWQQASKLTNPTERTEYATIVWSDCAI